MIDFVWKNLVKSGSLWFTAFALVLLVAGIWLTIESWAWLHPSTSQQEAADTTPSATIESTVSNSETLRNVGLLIGGGLAFVFAAWRAWIAERQSAVAQRQAETAQRQAENVQSQIAIAQSQAETAQQSLLNERYQRGAEMLGSKVLSVRLGGIYALARLAEEHPEQYHIQIVELFCAFVRFPTEDKNMRSNTEKCEDQDDRTLRADVQDVMKAIGSRSPAGISLELSQKNFKLYLRDANISDLQVHNSDLSGAWLTNANLSRAVLPYADLSGARLRRANLFGVKLRHANLSGAKFWGADLSKAILRNANLSGADLCGVDARSPTDRVPVRGLTQAQLDKARADPGNQPKLDGVLDAVTGEPLVWRGRPLIDVQG